MLSADPTRVSPDRIKDICVDGTFDRGNLRWTRHVAELRVVVAETARSIELGRLLWSWYLKWSSRKA